jgi:hypothetical protein
MIEWLIDWCLMPTWAVFQLYRGVTKIYVMTNIPTYKEHIKNQSFPWISKIAFLDITIPTIIKISVLATYVLNTIIQSNHQVQIYYCYWLWNILIYDRVVYNIIIHFFLWSLRMICPVSTEWPQYYKLFEHHCQQYFSYIITVSFIGRGNLSTWRKPPTCRKSLTNLIT